MRRVALGEGGHRVVHPHPKAQTDDEQEREGDFRPTVFDEVGHRIDVLPAGLNREGRMGMPFPEIVEAAEVAAGLLEERIQRFVMQDWIASKIGMRPRMRVE